MAVKIQINKRQHHKRENHLKIKQEHDANYFYLSVTFLSPPWLLALSSLNDFTSQATEVGLLWNNPLPTCSTETTPLQTDILTAC